MTRVTVSEPIWSAPTGKEATRQGLPKRRVYNERHEESDCHNCEWARGEWCFVTRKSRPLEYCAETFTRCQYWKPRH